MTNEGRQDHTWTEEELDRLLDEVGPLMRRQEQADVAEPEVPEPPFARPDPAFERALRARLLDTLDTEATPADAMEAETTTANAVEAHPTPDPREQGGAPHPARPRRRPRYARPGVWVGLAAALVVVVLVSVAVVEASVVLAVLAALMLVAVLVVRARRSQ